MDYEFVKQSLLISLYIFLGLIGFCLLLYLPRLVAWFSPLVKQKHLKNNKKNKIAVLIPARDESSVIKTLLDNLERQTYDKDYYDIHIIVKDPEDKTIAISKEYKNTFIHVVSSQKCKSDALNNCMHAIFEKFGKKYYDAYLIMDADCWMASDCLEEINNAFASGRQVVQCKKIVKNYYMPGKSIPLEAACNGIIWTLIDEMGNRFKSNHNITGMTIGTGICFRSDVINKIGGWPYNKTLTEDIEFMFDATLRGFTTYYCSYAHIYMEEADTLDMTNKRRTRWMTGVCDSKKIYNTRLSDECITLKEKINRYYCKALWIIYWMIGLAVVFFLINSLLSIFFLCIMSELIVYSLFNALIAFSVVYFSFFFMTLTAMIIDHKYIKLPFYNKVILLLIHPFFYMGYIKIVFKALFFKNNDGWERIERVEEGSKK
jgi:cellulose synthase/poly-beta-1,6-N-acetylglucosamine synthase-like glycosyltransferase